MHLIKFLGSVIGTASLGTLVLGGIVKGLHVFQTKTALGAAAKAFFRP